MKKTVAVATLALLAGAVSSYAQGQISIGEGPDNPTFGIQVYAAQVGSTVSVTAPGGATGFETMGSSGNTYGYNTSPGSATFAANSALGAGYDIPLLMGAGSGLSVSQLAPVGTAVTTWYSLGNQSTGLLGYWKTGQIVTSSTIGLGGAATVAIAAWNNEGGTVNSLAAAIAANDPWGVSNAGNVTLQSGSNPPANLPTSIESFSLVSTPEPSTIALGVIGASTLLFRRRNRK
jgi:hypothetical protein